MFTNRHSREIESNIRDKKVRTKRPGLNGQNKRVFNHTCLQIGTEGKYSQKHPGQKGRDKYASTEKPGQNSC